MRNSTTLSNLAIASAAAAAILLADNAAAQSTAEPGIEEIIVTSRRVAESLQSIPVSVSAFKAEDLERLGIDNIADTAAYTPNFLSNGGPTGHNDGFYYVRGVGQVDLNPATDPGVGTYIDGVYLGRVVGSSFDALDIARIEVLRGPQGTLFGRNTIGGAINVVTADPGDAMSGNVRLTGGSRSLFGAQAKVSGPLSDTVGFALSALYRKQDGWGKSIVTGKTFDDEDNTAGRVKLVFKPNDALTASLAADVSRVRGTGQHQILVGFNGMASSPLGVVLAPQIGADVNSGDIYVNRSSITNPRSDLDANGASLTIDWKPGAFGFKSITSYRDLEQIANGDFDGSRINFYQSEFTTRQHQASQELQLTREGERWTGLLGAYYFKEGAFHNNFITLGGNNGCALFPLPFPFGGPPPTLCGANPYATALVNRSIGNNQQVKVDVEAKALFAHGTFKFNDQWSASLGLRYTDEKKTQAYDFFIDNTANVFNFGCVPPGVPGFPPTGLCFPLLPPAIVPTLSPRNPNVGVPTTYSNSWSEVTPKLGVEFKPAEQQLYYISYSEGFKSGGFNGRPTPGPTGQFASVQPYDPERLKTVELGAKTQFANNRVRFNVSVFASRYDDIQLLVLGPSGFFENRNAGRADIKGVEIELLAKPVPQFQLNLSLGFMDHEYKELSADAIRSGFTLSNKLPMTPRTNGSLGAEYTWSLDGRGAVTLRGDYSYRSQVFFGAPNGPLEQESSLGLLNLRLGYEFANQRMKLVAFGRNVTDEEYFSNGQDVRGPLGVAFVGVGAPREWGVEFSYRFGQ